MEAFHEQLRLETQGQVPIPPALPFFEEMLKDAPKISKTIGHVHHRNSHEESIVRLKTQLIVHIK